MSHSGPEAGSAYQRTDKMLTAALNDELVMMSVELGHYFSLNAVGTRIWELLETPRSFDALLATLTEEYEAEPEVIRSEVGNFLARLESEGLVRTVAE